MTKLLARARPVIVLALMTGFGGCDLKDTLLEPQQPGIIGPEAVGSPTAADALRKGAIDRLRRATEGDNNGGLWTMSGLLADEWKSGDTFVQRVETDGRTIQSNNAELIEEYQEQHRARQSARGAIAQLQHFLPTPLRYQAEMWWVMGYAELNLPDNWGNGVPYSRLEDGVPVYEASKSSAEGFILSLSHLVSALALAT